MKGIEYADEIVSLYQKNMLGIKKIQDHFRANNISIGMPNIRFILKEKGVEMRNSGRQKNPENNLKLNPFKGHKTKEFELTKKMSRSMYASNDNRSTRHYYYSL